MIRNPLDLYHYLNLTFKYRYFDIITPQDYYYLDTGLRHAFQYLKQTLYARKFFVKVPNLNCFSRVYIDYLDVF